MPTTHCCLVQSLRHLLLVLHHKDSWALLHKIALQWTTGAISFTLLKLRTLSAIARDGIMEFMEESRHMLGPELWTQVSRWPSRHAGQCWPVLGGTLSTMENGV